jgi:hypothetical protein
MYYSSPFAITIELQTPKYIWTIVLKAGWMDGWRGWKDVIVVVSWPGAKSRPYGSHSPFVSPLVRPKTPEMYKRRKLS